MNIDFRPYFKSGSKIFDLEGIIEENKTQYLIDNLDLIFPVRYKGKIYDLNGEFLLDLDLDYAYNTQCSRCLKDMVKSIHANLKAVLIDEKDEDDMEDDPTMEYIILDENGFSIDDFIFSGIITSMPMKVLCKETCKGLCPQCGKDLNDGPCDCEKEDFIDPRFAKLKGLFKEEV
ncbi:DUF177 domain-containing protein [Peptoniphilus sp. GNH]|nr:putative ACR [Clostridiales bacterium KA00134]UHR02999.1 DUF177 domain-containing protein [Peptoniphilus sp. GNH]